MDSVSVIGEHAHVAGFPQFRGMDTGQRQRAAALSASVLALMDVDESLRSKPSLMSYLHQMEPELLEGLDARVVSWVLNKAQETLKGIGTVLLFSAPLAC